MKIIDIGFDKFTLVGNLYLDAEIDLHRYINRLGLNIRSSGTSRIIAIGESIYIEYDLLKGKVEKKGNFRIELNPSKIDKEVYADLVFTIKPMCHDLHFTRIDIAFDCDFNLSDYMHEHKHAVSWADFGGATGSVETKYYGSRNSDFYSRTYNKKKQLKDTSELEFDKYEHWWRYELEIKNRVACQSMIALDLPVFERVRFKKVGYEGLEGEDRIMVQALVEHPEQMGLLSKYKRSKYRKIISDLESGDITPIFEKALKNKLPTLKRELRAWQPVESFIDIANRQWF